MKLSRLTDRFHPHAILAAVTRTTKDAAVLVDLLPQIFPSAEVAADLLFFLPAVDDKRHQKKFTAANLPYHTRDNQWLTQYIQNVLIQTNNPDQFKVRTANIKKFVATSPEFDIARNNYEHNMVKNQINFMMHSDLPNGLLMDVQYDKANHDTVMTPVYHPWEARRADNVDELFRNGVVFAMNKLGIDPKSTTTALEIYADLWRPQTMERAFANQFHVVPFANQAQLSPNAYHQNDHKADWLRQREYQYYQAHHDVIDGLGLHHFAQDMTPDEVATMNQNVAKWEDRYQNLVAPQNLEELARALAKQVDVVREQTDKGVES